MEACVSQYISKMDTQLLSSRNCCLLCQGSGSWSNGVQARHHHQCSSSNAAYSSLGT
uniref:1 2-diacylglycerol 3-beta-galactosyltransferase n=1 Tax=Rhizophora mucronata TaxID=61149 RepID=A0A2P2JQA0_RHIMU